MPPASSGRQAHRQVPPKGGLVGASRRSCIVALSLVGVGSACAIDLPISERIASVRPLAMRVEAIDFVPDPDRPPRSEALPVESIRAIPFIVDDQGPLTPERIEAELEPIWLACPMQPIQGLFACLSGQLPLALDEIEDCPPVDFSALDPSLGTELPAMPAPCRIPVGVGASTPAEPSMQVPLDFNFFLGGDLELTMIGHRTDGVSTERCAEALLGEQPVPFECLVAVQRASIGPDAEILRLAADAGLPIDQLGSLPPDDQIPEADRNTQVTGFRVVVSDEPVGRDDLLRVLEEQGTEVAAGDTLMARAGQTLVIETTSPEDDLQTYLISAEDGMYEERQENYRGDWYRTWGTLLSNDSDDPVSYNTWQMIPGEQDDIESDLPPDGRATLYFVQRDDRQGVSWFWFHVMVTP
ncbi:hypothetical protein [Paraliomyxa miuraensis]|uniref:hypothetical protein n=1 Tax=Paraliomyxa miuraensis TaxID=376150 RepID=UPI0022505F24|nr:hypothetical protein [Paraliomyxa miuraensis]MCX4241469.1 hypothetical protein [Paraliomyxa miuraensis]